MSTPCMFTTAAVLSPRRLTAPLVRRHPAQAVRHGRRPDARAADGLRGQLLSAVLTIEGAAIGLSVSAAELRMALRDLHRS